MKPLILDPKIVLPWEHEETEIRLLAKAMAEKQKGRHMEQIILDAVASLDELYAIGLDAYRDKYNVADISEGWKHVPPVPVLGAPSDLQGLGMYVIYNGHNRRAAALRAGLLLPSVLVEKARDFDYLEMAGELIPDDKDIQLFRFGRIAEITFGSAREYHKRKK